MRHAAYLALQPACGISINFLDHHNILTWPSTLCNKGQFAPHPSATLIGLTGASAFVGPNIAAFNFAATPFTREPVWPSDKALGW